MVGKECGKFGNLYTITESDTVIKKWTKINNARQL